MSISAIFMGILGLAVSFFPEEIMSRYGAQPDGITTIVMQIAGALYLGFAILNWMARGNLIGGIYSRPVALGNFLHFAVVAVMLLRALTRNQWASALLIVEVFYAILAVWFGLVLFGSPVKSQSVLES